MSRSFKHTPMSGIGSNGSAKHDKRLAAHGVRSAHKKALKNTDDFEDFLPPHRFECSHNNVWSWNRDGHQRWCGLDAKDRNRYESTLNGTADDWDMIYHKTWPPDWYKNMMRK